LENGIDVPTPAVKAVKEKKAPTSEFYCETCGVSAHSAAALEIHFNGQKHKRKTKPQRQFITFIRPQLTKILW
jgi:hypothetical protein